MQDGPLIASVAALIGDPARANMLTALMDGRALTVSELSQAAGVALPTASGHLAKLAAGGLVAAERQGRHRYMRLSGPDVAEVLEVLMGLAQRTGQTRIRTGPRDPALRAARVCYDHLAGERAVALMGRLMTDGLVTDTREPAVTEAGRRFFAALGIETDPAARSRRPLCRRCLDWSERRDHLGGALGARVLDLVVERRWARRQEGRVVAFTPEGGRAFDAAFGTGR